MEPKNLPITFKTAKESWGVMDMALIGNPCDSVLVHYPSGKLILRVNKRFLTFIGDLNENCDLRDGPTRGKSGGEKDKRFRDAGEI